MKHWNFTAGCILFLFSRWIDGIGETTVHAYPSSSDYLTFPPVLPTTTAVCPNGMILCHGQCKQTCERISTTHAQLMCLHDEIFCLNSGRCVKRNYGCFREPTPNALVKCSPSEVFCLQTGSCIHRHVSCDEERKVIHKSCNSGENLCLKSGKCVPRNSKCGVEDRENKCPDDEVFCMEERHCVKREHGCMEKEQKCYENHIFCPQKGKCVHKAERCDNVDYKENKLHACQEHEFFCLKSGSCIPKDQECTSNVDEKPNSAHRCEHNEKFCLLSGKCLTKERQCSYGDKEKQTCLSYEVFCMKKGGCYPRDHRCDGSAEIRRLKQSCLENQVFCMNKGICVSKEDQCPDENSDKQPKTHHCLNDQIFCLSKGMCISKGSRCIEKTSKKQSKVIHCQGDDIFCVRKGICISKDKKCNDNDSDQKKQMHFCKLNEVFCVNKGLCVSKKNHCTDNPLENRPEKRLCGGSEIFCVQTGKCISTSETCGKEEGTGSIMKCPPQQVWCLQNGRCVGRDEPCKGDNNGCDSNHGHPSKSKDCKEKRVASICNHDEVFCLKTGKCVPLITTKCDISYQTRRLCKENALFCLKTSACIKQHFGYKTEQFEKFRKEIRHVKSVFCLQRGRCVQYIKRNFFKDIKHTKRIWMCSKNEVFCLSQRNYNSRFMMHKHSENGNRYPNVRNLCNTEAIFCLKISFCTIRNPNCRKNTNEKTRRICDPRGQFCLEKGKCLSHKRKSCNSFKENLGKQNITEFSQCKMNHLFCLQRRLQMRNASCRRNETFCLQTGKCSTRRPECVGNVTKVEFNKILYCSSDTLFCLQSNRCFDTLYNNIYPPKSEFCGPREVHCLKTGSCINIGQRCYTNENRETESPTLCQKTEIFCIKHNTCIFNGTLCRRYKTFVPTRTVCQGRKLCLETEKCIALNDLCKQATATVIKSVHLCSGKNGLFCLQQGFCHTNASFCYKNTFENKISCKHNTIFCVHKLNCSLLNTSCTNITSVTGVKELVRRRCGITEILCMENGTCVRPNKNHCFNISTIELKRRWNFKCKTGQVFCLFSGLCIEGKPICNRMINRRNVTVCQDDEFVCLKTNQCVKKKYLILSEKALDSLICNTSETFCLKKGKCALHCERDEGENNPFTNKTSISPCHKRRWECNNIGITLNSTSVFCQMGKVFCLERKECVSPLNLCKKENCSFSQKYYCLREGRCIRINESCDGKNLSKHRVSCGNDEIFCLASGSCLRKSCIRSRYIKGTSSTDTIEYISVTKNQLTTTATIIQNTTDKDIGPSPKPGEKVRSTVITPHQRSDVPTPSLSSTSQHVQHTKTMTENHTHVTTESAPYLGNRVIILNEIVTVNSYVKFQFLDYIDYLLHSRQLSLPKQQIAIRLECSYDSGVLMHSGSVVVTNEIIKMTDEIIVTTDGSSNGLVTCQIKPVQREVIDGYIYHIGVMAIPRTVMYNITMLTDFVTLTEGTEIWNLPNLQNLFHLEFREKTPTIDPLLEIVTNISQTMEAYNKSIKLYQDSLPFYLRMTLFNTPLDTYGMPVAYIMSKSGGSSRWRRIGYSGMIIDGANQIEKVRIHIHSAFSGNLHIMFQSRGHNEKQYVLTLQVNPVNNAPSLILPDRVMDSLESIMIQPYTGEKIFVIARDIMNNVFHDDDGENIGLAVLGAASDKLGSWQFESNGVWETIPVINSSIISPGSKTFTSILLSPLDKIKFVPSVGQYLWSTREAIRDTKLYGLAWDGTDLNINQTYRHGHVILKRCSSYMKMCGEGGHSSYSREVIPLFINKAGCDDRPGSQMEADLCGVCGGYDDCVDCNGKLNGGAVIDSCGDCTEGNTGLSRDYRRDCRQQCGQNIFHQELGICVPKEFDIGEMMAFFMNCDGQMYSDAYINKCGYCVLGNTSLPEDHGEDRCGECDGHNSCVDCNDVAYGNFVEDVCGKCLLEEDSEFNKGCQKLGFVKPTMFGSRGRRMLTITGADLFTYKTVSCELRSTSVNKVLTLKVEMFDKDRSLIHATTDKLQLSDASTYHLYCTFDQKTSTELGLTNQSITIFPPPEIQMITRSQMKVGERQKVTVTGGGILNTGYIKCAVKCPYIDRSIRCFSTKEDLSGFMLYPGLRMNNTACKCDLSDMSKIQRAMSYQLTILLEPLSDDIVSGLNYAAYNILASAPNLISAEFDNTYCSVILHFDVPVEGPKVCSLLFTESSYAKLGMNSNCLFFGKKLVVILRRREFTLRPGDALEIKPSTIKRKFSHRDFASYSVGNVTIQEPSKKMQLNAELVGENVVGSCDPYDLYIKKSGSLGCIDFVFNWTVTTDSSNLSSTTISDLSELQTRLGDLSPTTWMLKGLSSEVLPGSTYTFIVTITNMMDQSEMMLSANVTRLVDNKPINVRLRLLSQINPDPIRTMKMIALVVPSECSGIKMKETVFMYKWTSSSADVNIHSHLNMPFGIIKRGTLRGGTKYTIRVTVFKQNDETVTDQSSVTFTTITQPLQVIIPPFIQTLPYVDTLLDASKSNDPDNIPQDAFYTWTCSKESSPDIPHYILHNGSRTMVETLVRPESLQDPTLTIPANILHTGRYIWTVTMTKGKRSSSTSVIVQVVDNRAPLIVVDTREITINSEEPLRLSSQISTYNKKPVQLFWNCGLTDGYDYVNIEQYVRQSSRLFYESEEPLTNYIFGLYLDWGLPSGGTYPIQVTAIAGENSLSRTERIRVTVNAPPVTGDVSISPLNGTALSTKFKVLFGEGWVDPEGDNVQFYVYTQHLEESKISRLNARPLTDVLTYEMMLPSGQFLVQIKVCDLLDSCTIYIIPDKIFVEEMIMTNEKMSTLVDGVSELLKTDMNQAVGMAMSLSSMMKDSNHSETLGDVVNDMAYSLLSSSSAEFAPDEASSVLDMANSMIRSMSESGILTDKVITESHTKALQLTSIVTSSRSSDKRRRRAVDTSTINSISPMTKSQAETVLTTYSVTFSGKTEDQITTQSAKDFLLAMDNMKIGLCAGVTYAENALVAESPMTTLRVQKRTFDNIASDIFPVTCLNCTITNTAYVNYGNEIQDTYRIWNCSYGGQCYGACLTSTQMTKDLVTATSPQRFTIDQTRRSDLVSLQLINPTTYELMSIFGLTQHISLTIPVYGDYNASAVSLQCQQWTGSNWTKEACVSQTPYLHDEIYLINCTCDSLGVVSVFEAPLVVESTTALTTSSSVSRTTEMTTFLVNSSSQIPIANTTTANATHMTTVSQNVIYTASVYTTEQTTTPPHSLLVPESAGKVYILFALHDNYATVVGNDVDNFKLHIMKILTSFLLIPASRIMNLRVEEVKDDDDDAGSINIMFEIFSRALESEPTMGEVIYKLKESITTGSLVVTSPSGQRLVIDTNSFVWSTSELDPEVDTGKNYTVFIVSGAVGAFVLIMIMTGIVIYLIKTKANKSQQVSQSPTQFGPNMQGVDIPRPMGNKPNVCVGNWMENECTTEASASSNSFATSDPPTYKGLSKNVTKLPPIQN